jgi:predicted DNA-binding transcriptional regulator AlpA
MIPQPSDTGGLPICVRFKNLRAAGIAHSWPQLLSLVRTQGFPPGRWIGPNSRAWFVQEVEDWLANRPTAHKVPPEARKPRGRPRKQAA